MEDHEKHSRFMQSLPDDVQELKDIIEVQKVQLTVLQRKLKLYTNPYVLSVSFDKKNNKKNHKKD